MSTPRSPRAARLGATLCLGALAAGTLAGCGSTAPRDGKHLTIGIKFDQPGLGLKKGYGYEGMDVEVARYVAKKLGVDESGITWIQAPSSQRETLISTGQVDYIVGTYSITDARKKKVDFAGPYFIAGQSLLVRSDDDSIQSVDGLKGKRLCSVTGSTSAQNIAKKVPGVNLQNFSTYSECVAGLNAKAVDALTTDDAILAGYAAQEVYKGKLKLAGKPFTQEKYGIGLKKGDKDRCQKITQAINDMISDGTWKKLVDANLGSTGYQPPQGNPPKPGACA